MSHEGYLIMPDKITAAKRLHLLHKKDLLTAERSFLAEKQAFVRNALKAVNQELKKLKTA